MTGPAVGACSTRASRWPTREIARDFRGQLLRPGDEGYEAARRIWNGPVDRLPGLIARFTGLAGRG